MTIDIATDSPAILIAAVGDDLTPTERRIAEAVLNDPSLLAFGTVAEVARNVGTSRPSVVRFAVKLGFEGFSELQDSVRQRLSKRLFRPSERIRRDEGPATRSSRAILTDAVTAVFDALHGERLATLGDPIAQAENVWVVTGETSRAGANAFVSGLSIVKPHVSMVEEHSVGTALADASHGDVAVAFDFYRYRQHAVDTARAFAKSGADIVAITDGPLSPLAQLTDTWLGIKVPAVGPFDSSVPAVAVAELLVAHVARTLHASATDRIDKTEAMWAATGTFTDS